MLKSNCGDKVGSVALTLPGLCREMGLWERLRVYPVAPASFPGAPGPLARGSISKTMMPEGIMEIPVWFYFFFSSQWASADIKYMMIFKETNQNPPRKMQTPWICCALKKMQWVYDLLRHTRDSFPLTDGNLRLFCFLPLCMTRPDCVKLLASKPGCE